MMDVFVRRERDAKHTTHVKDPGGEASRGNGVSDAASFAETHLAVGRSNCQECRCPFFLPTCDICDMVANQPER